MRPKSRRKSRKTSHRISYTFKLSPDNPDHAIAIKWLNAQKNRQGELVDLIIAQSKRGSGGVVLPLGQSPKDGGGKDQPDDQEDTWETRLARVFANELRTVLTAGGMYVPSVPILNQVPKTEVDDEGNPVYHDEKGKAYRLAIDEDGEEYHAIPIYHKQMNDTLNSVIAGFDTWA